MRNIDFNKYQSALIIGNGFDLSLGLSTSYMDFVNSDEFQILLNMQNQLAIYLKVNAELQNWIDIENELKLYSKNEDNAKFKTEYEALCKQLVVYINNIDYSSINKNSKAYEVLTNLSSTKNNIILDFNYTASTKEIEKGFIMPYRISIIHPSNALYTGYIGDETSLAETTCHTGKPKQGAYRL